MIAALTLVVTLLLGGLYFNQAQVVAWYWNRQLDAAADDAIPGQVRRLATLDEAALRHLVGRLDAERTVLADAAREALLDYVAQSATLSDEEAAARLEHLSRRLAADVERLQGTGRDAAAELAVRILMLGELRKALPGERTIDACEHVLRVAAPERRWSPQSPSETERIASAERMFNAGAEEKELRQLQRVGTVPDDHLVALPGGALPVAPAEIAHESSSTATNEPQQSIEDSAKSGVANRSEHSVETVVAEPRRLVIDERTVRPMESASLAEIAPEDKSRLPGDSAPRTSPPVDEPPTIRLVRMLHSSDATRAAGAERALREQGFNERHLEVAKRLCDPDPRVRREWLELLPRIRGINARPWLLWLTGDTDADVRLAAITMLATSNDPEMGERMRELLHTDPDPRIRRQAERFLNQSRAHR